MSEFFGAADPDRAKKDKLFARGWKVVSGDNKRTVRWKRPDDGKLFSEEQAFEILERLEAQK